MDPDRWRQIKELYHAARAQTDDDREAYVSSACAGDRALLADVQELLAQPTSTDNLLSVFGGPELALVASLNSQTEASLHAGQRIGVYEVLGAIGAGAMGEVYRARDTKLGRDVALKRLPPALTADPDRLARLRREARVLASLNHPNIAAIHGIEESDGLALVLELVEGETLEERLARGRMPVATTIAFARQIADALDTAHSKGITHCDLKPANIKITPDGVVKVLDFGIARVTDGSLTSGSPLAPTAAGPGTRRAGTPAYMSPEQARGEAVDKRTDIWAFGCVVYEMLTGQKAFDGEPATDITMNTAVCGLNLDALPAGTPSAVRRLLARCLQPDPKRRLRDIADGWSEIDETPDVVSAGAGQGAAMMQWRTRGLVAIAAVLLTLFAGVEVVSRWSESSTAAAMRQFVVLPPEGTMFADSQYTPGFAVSPDGQRLAFVAIDRSGRRTLWVRRLDSLEAEAVPGTDRAQFPFWSPDGASVAFFADGKLKKVALDRTAPTTVADVPLSADRPGGGAWSRNGFIVFAPSTRSGLFRVPDAGGLLAPVTDLNAAGDLGHVWPQFLPDGRHFLFVVRGAPTRRGIYVGSIDAPATKRILPAREKALYASPGYLLFLHDGTLMTRRFDPRRYEVSGDPVPLVESVAHLSSEARASYDVSDTGMLVYRASGPLAAVQPIWVDRLGKTVAPVGEPGHYVTIRLSPDGSRLAAELHERKGTGDLWIVDLARKSSSRFTYDGMHNNVAVWSPDGNRIVFRGRPDGGANLHLKSLGADSDEPLLPPGPEREPTDWSPDGRNILYHQTEPNAGDDLWVLQMPERRPVPFLRSEFAERDGRFSPNGRWVAYVSNETGRDEVYVRSFPEATGKVKVSVNGGQTPRWSRDGRELFFIVPGNSVLTTPVTSVLMAPVKTNGRFVAGVPQSLFTTDIPVGGEYRNRFEVDGHRFLIIPNAPGPIPPTPPVTVVVNWTSLLKNTK